MTDATVYLYFKDGTSGRGRRRSGTHFAGKGALDWAISRDCFEYLQRRGIRTHYLASPSERLTLVRWLDRKLELEVVSRRVAAGSPHPLVVPRPPCARVRKAGASLP